MQQGRYYLGRVIKLGVLTQELFMNAIVDSPTVAIGKFNWTITDVVDKRNEGFPYVFGKLSKFASEGYVTVVDTDARSQIDEPTENLLIASAPFVYLPNFSGMAYLHVWNQIQEELFPRRFKTIIEAAYNNFFVECTVEPISDYRAFAAKLQEINTFTEISAKVHPPNPLFGRLWGSLNEYVKKRQASEMSVKEVSSDNEGLKTDIIALIIGIMENPQYDPPTIPDITDSALLMAADGYGRGKVVGERSGGKVVIRTSETKKSFLLERNPAPDELAEESRKHFGQINEERDMQHS
jgi:hypothetical protein